MLNKNINKLLFYSLLAGITGSMYSVIFNLYLRDIGIENKFISNMTSLELFGSAILGLLLGIAGDKFGKSFFLKFLTISVGFFLIIRAVFPYSYVLFIISFLNGGFMAGRAIIINTLMVENTDTSSRGKAFGYLIAINMGTGLFGNSFGGFLGDHIGLQNTLIISGLLFLCSSLPIITLHDRNRNNESIKQIFDFSSLNISERKIMSGYLISTFTVGFGAGLFIHFGNLIFKDLFSMNPTMIGIALSIAQAGTAVGAALSPLLSKKFGALNYTGILQFFVVPLIIGLAYVRDPYMFTVLYALRFSFMNMTSPVMNNIVLSNLPKNKITAINSLNNLLNNLTRTVATALFGIIVGSTVSGYKILFLISGLFYFINFIVFMFIFMPLKNDEKTMNLYKKE